MLYNLRFFLQNAVCFMMLNCLVPVLFTFCIESVLKLRKEFWRERVNVVTEKLENFLWKNHSTF